MASLSINKSSHEKKQRVQMINHCFQGALNIKDHRPDRGNYGSAFAVKFLEFIKNSTNQAEQKVLILGCGDGKNDLLPILEILTQKEATSTKIRFDCFDDSESLLGLLINDLIGKGFNKNVETEEIWEKSNISIKLKCMDIENSNFFSEIKSNNYNWIIAFCVLHHLTNWQSILFQLNNKNILSDDGSIFILTVEDPYFYILENYYDKNITDSFLKNYTLDDKMNALIKFSKILYKIKYEANQSLCCCSASGVDIAPFAQFLNYFFSIEEILRKESERIIDKKFLLDAVKSEPPQHTMLFWGSKSKLENDFSESFDSDMKDSLIREIETEIDENDNDKYKSTLHIYQFKKNKNGHHYYQEGTTYGITERFIEDFIKFSMEEKEESKVKDQNSINNLLFLQILLSRLGLTRDDSFVSINLYPIGLNADGHPYVKTTSSNSTFYSLHSSRKDDQQNFLDYIWAASFFRLNAISKEYDPSHFSVAHAILKIKKKMIWVFSSSPEGEIEIKFKKNDYFEFIHIAVPDTYVQVTYDDEFQNELLKYISPIEVIRYNNYFAFNFDEVINKLFNSDKIELFKEKLHKENIMDVKKIAADREKIKNIFNELGPEFKTYSKELADSIPLISVMTRNFGNIIYIPNTVFENPYIANGGILLSQKNADIKKLERSSFFSRKVHFLKKLMDKFTQKALQPELGNHFINLAKNVHFQAIKAALGAIMSRNMSHNIGSHVIADMVSKGVNGGEGDINTFFRYLQNRMDFIAQITTEFPEWTYPAYFNKEIMRIFYENYLLIDRIGVSEGLKAYTWTEDWKQGCMRGKVIVRTGIKTNGEFIWGVNEYLMGNIEDDLQLAIPGGIVGYHAFYIIIENMIRNAAKHDYAVRVPKMLNDEERKKILIIKNNGTELTSKDPDLQIFDLNSNEIKDTELFKHYRAIVIESSCFKKNARIDSNKIELKNQDYSILDLHRIYIACHDENCEGCAFESNKTWGQSTFSYHLLSYNEWTALKKKLVYNEFLNYLLKIPLRINIRVDDIPDKNYVWVTIWDDMPQFAQYAFDKNNDARHEVSSGIPDERIENRNVEINLFGFLNDCLRDSFIRETGELKKENWGLAELKICAGFLQNRKPEEIGISGSNIIDYGIDFFSLTTEHVITEEDNINNGYPKMLIKAIPVEKTGIEMPKLAPEDIYFLGYRFWVKKPKSVAITGEYLPKGAE